MRILHVCLAASYTEGMTYQDNLLTEQNSADGHEVTIITNCSKYENGKLVYSAPEDTILQNGCRLIRLEYDKIINKFISGKVRKVSKLRTLIEEIKPDVILYHGVVGWEMFTVSEYKKENPNTKLYMDSHEDFNNSAQNYISKLFQYKILNKMIVNKTIEYVDKYLYISYECALFLEEMYGIPKEKMEFFPLGGLIIDQNQKEYNKMKIRKELNLAPDDILIVHTGKMDKLKRTVEILKAFNSVNSERLKLILIGSISDTIAKEVSSLTENNPNIKNLGWKNGEELLEYLCACDLYLQPGSQSATLQNALCCESAVAIYPYESHLYFLPKEAAFYIETQKDIEQMLKDISNNIESVNLKKENSFIIAQSILDYKVLANRLYV